MRSLAGKTVFITGASRGIGKAIGLRAAADGATVVIAAKSAEPHPKLPGTIHTAAREIEKAGGRALALQVDIRFEDQVYRAMAQAVETFGGLDVVVNNASAIFLAGTVETPMKRFDLMHQVNVRGTYLCSQAAIPHLAKAENPHVLNLSPPIDRATSWHPKWFAPHVAYTMAKYGMSLCVLGMAEELRDRGIAVNALWPRTVIDTAALAMLGGAVKREATRKPEIMADAAHAILTRPSSGCTGNFFIDDEVLAEEGVTDLDRYAVSPGARLHPDFFVEPAG
ncbi:MAG TPA: NAD(P)-dependent oxidoreductase [Thermoanaerobaculia bacterium]|nr:NAD(P)-dependent oxidoreductase [Thermoanaerobaculia bacterium]